MARPSRRASWRRPIWWCWSSPGAMATCPPVRRARSPSWSMRRRCGWAKTAWSSWPIPRPSSATTSSPMPSATPSMASSCAPSARGWRPATPAMSSPRPTTCASASSPPSAAGCKIVRRRRVARTAHPARRAATGARLRRPRDRSRAIARRPAWRAERRHLRRGRGDGGRRQVDAGRRGRAPTRRRPRPPSPAASRTSSAPARRATPA